MNVTLVTGSKAHTLDLSRELEKRGLFHELIIGYPRSRLGSMEGIPAEKVFTSPLYHAPMIALMKGGFANSQIVQQLESLGNDRLDHIARRRLDDVDVLISMAGAGLLSGAAIQKRGGKWICDRGAAHIGWQKKVLDPEYDRLGITWQGISPEKVEFEVREYEGADRIYVPSEFVRRTFLEEGIDPGKVEVHSLGVSLSEFRPLADRKPNEMFTILGAGQMGVQKGLHVLLDAVRRLDSSVRVEWAGLPLPEARSIVDEMKKLCDFRVLGHQSTAELARLMGQADAFVLPSIQDGFGMVATQAMACGTPVVLSDATGAAELVVSGENGFVFPSGDGGKLAACLASLREEAEFARQVGENGRGVVSRLGGWDSYGESVAGSLRLIAG